MRCCALARTRTSPTGCGMACLHRGGATAHTRRRPLTWPGPCAQHGHTPLMEAVIHNRCHLLPRLLAGGAQVDLWDLVRRRSPCAPVRSVTHAPAPRRAACRPLRSPPGRAGPSAPRRCWQQARTSTSTRCVASPNHRASCRAGAASPPRLHDAAARDRYPGRQRCAATRRSSQGRGRHGAPAVGGRRRHQRPREGACSAAGARRT